MGENKDKCPYCGTEDVISQIAFENCECYDSQSYVCQCPKCKKIFTARLWRTAVVVGTWKSEKTVEDVDFPYSSPRTV